MKNIIKWILIGVVGLVLLVMLLPGESPSDNDGNPTVDNVPGEITTLAGFEASSFYQKYGITKGSSWALQAGEINNTYDISGFEDLSFEIETEEGQITGYGFSFLAFVSLGEKEYKLIENLLSILSQDSTSPAMNFIKENAGIPVKNDNTSVFDTEPFVWGDYKIFARKVGGSVIAIEKF